MIFQNNRDLSLVEQKRLQWAKEREEMAKLGEIFSHSSSSNTKYEKTSIRTFYSNLDLSEDNYRKDSYDKNFNVGNFNKHNRSNGNGEDLHQPATPSENDRRISRSPSLPPINRKKYVNGGNVPNFIRNSTEEDTGYTSGSPNHSDGTPDIWTNTAVELPTKEPHSNVTYVEAVEYPLNNGSNNSHSTIRLAPNYHHHHHRNHPSNRRDLSHLIDNENKYYDEEEHNSRNRKKIVTEINELDDSAMPKYVRGQVHKMSPDSLDMGHETDFSIPKSLGTPSSSSSSAGQSFSSMSQSYQEYSFQKVKEERAKWGDRGVTVGHLYDPLGKDLTNGKSNRNVPVWLEKGLNDIRDSEDESVRSHIRGQNTPIDPNILAERANKRRKAMELQTAIKEQLRERERIKKWEKEQRLREEQMEEERVLQQIEAERTRFEYEQRLQQEKLDNEKKKHEMMRRALEKAEMEAKIEKEKRKKTKKKETINQICDIAKMEHDFEKEKKGTEDEDIIDIKTEPFQKEYDEDTTEKILIGTPIKLRKRVSIPTEDKSTKKATEENAMIKKQTEIKENKSINKLKEQPSGEKQIKFIDRNSATDNDGIALVLQSMTPVVPLPITNDFLGLNNSVNNLQLALIVAQQQHQINQQAQHLNSMSCNSSIMPVDFLSNTNNGGGVLALNNFYQNQRFIQSPLVYQQIDMERQNSPSVSKLTVNQDKSQGKNIDDEVVGKKQEIIKFNENENDIPKWSNDKHNKECNFCCKIHGNSRSDTLKSNNITETVYETLPQSEVPPLKYQLPHEGTFTKENSVNPLAKIDVSTSTSLDSNMSIVHLSNPGGKILTPRKYRNSSLDMVSTVDVAIQTEANNKNCDLCCHHHLYLKEISTVTTSVTQTSKNKVPLNGTESEGNLAHDGLKEFEKETTTTTTTTTTTIRSKSRDKKPKIEARPKWGVNRPLMQYIKASERDPFCLRNRRKKYQQRSFIIKTEGREDDDEMTMNDDSGHQTATDDSNNEKQMTETETISTIDDSDNKSSIMRRNICTEILPIKTDRNGKIYLNFREASFIMKEDNVKRQNSKETKEKIMNRRSTVDNLPNVEVLDKVLEKNNNYDLCSNYDNNKLNLNIQQSKKIKDFSNLEVIKINKKLKKRNSSDNVDIESYRVLTDMA